MEYDEFASRIDHTVLGPAITLADVRRALDEAAHYGMNACVPPCYAAEAAAYAPDVTLVTVIGFPHGHHTAGTKRREAVEAVDDGADELDAVINVGRLKSGDRDAVADDLAAVVEAVSVPVKAIVETALLDGDELRRACEAARGAGAEFVKTSTGFADGGATAADVATMAEYLPVKASGGVGSYDDAMAMFDAGAHRVGASSGVALVEGFPGPGGPDPDSDPAYGADGD